MIPDYRHPAVDDEVADTPAKKQARLALHEARVHKFFEKMDAPAIGGPKSVGDPKVERIANRYFALAKDNALLCGAGRGVVGVMLGVLALFSALSVQNA